ncbi:MAG: DNRLRE domain-containing protein [Phycisphaerales bacterium]
MLQPSGIIASVCAAAFAAQSLAQVTVELTSSKDNTMYQPSSSTQLSNGAGEHMFIGKTQGGYARRALLQFNLSSIPANATIQEVTLRLNMSRSIADIAQMRVHRVSAQWGEGASNAGGQEGGGATALAGDATWQYSTYPTLQWFQGGGTFIGTASATKNIGAVGTYELSTDGLLADVQAWRAAPATNFGWILIGNESGIGTAKRFDTREFSVAANRPKLIVTYTLPPVCDSIDFNNDSSLFDPQDIDAFLSVYSEGPCIPAGATCNDIDFNNDTSVFDPCDIASFLQLYSEGPCSICG